MTDHKAARKRFSPPTKADLQAEAARAMLAALKVAWHEMRHTTATRSSFTDALDAVDAAIAQAEAAGIKAEG
jgi:cytochrome c556